MKQRRCPPIYVDDEVWYVIKGMQKDADMSASEVMWALFEAFHVCRLPFSEPSLSGARGEVLKRLLAASRVPVGDKIEDFKLYKKALGLRD